MKTLLTVTLFICAYSLTSFAQEETERIETEPKIQSSEVKVESKENKAENNSIKDPENFKKQEKNIHRDHKELPHDFPKFEDTGDQAKDIDTYTKRKEKWILENPDKYKELVNNSSGQTQKSDDRQKPHAVKVVKSK